MFRISSTTATADSSTEQFDPATQCPQENSIVPASLTTDCPESSYKFERKTSGSDDNRGSKLDDSAARLRRSLPIQIGSSKYPGSLHTRTRKPRIHQRAYLEDWRHLVHHVPAIRPNRIANWRPTDGLGVRDANESSDGVTYVDDQFCSRQLDFCRRDLRG